MDVVDSITDEFCLQTKVAFGDPDDFGEKGGLKAMGESLKRGHVLVMSMWDDHGKRQNRKKVEKIIVNSF